MNGSATIGTFKQMNIKKHNSEFCRENKLEISVEIHHSIDMNSGTPAHGSVSNDKDKSKDLFSDDENENIDLNNNVSLTIPCFSHKINTKKLIQMTKLKSSKNSFRNKVKEKIHMKINQ